jgi:hypothetical protein
MYWVAHRDHNGREAEQTGHVGVVRRLFGGSLTANGVSRVRTALRKTSTSTMLNNSHKVGAPQSPEPAKSPGIPGTPHRTAPRPLEHGHELVTSYARLRLLGLVRQQLRKTIARRTGRVRCLASPPPFIKRGGVGARSAFSLVPHPSFSV